MACSKYSASCKKYTLGSMMLVGCCFGIYLMYFHKGPPKDILAANLRKTLQNGGGDYVDEVSDEPSVNSRLKWEKFLRDNNYVSIGELYNKCEEGKDRIMLGKTIMLADEKLGGVKSRTIANITWDKFIDDGEMSIQVWYNDNELYSNKWDLCTIDETEDNRIIFCPIQAGYKEYVKEKKIPNYLPKGRYVTKIKVTNQDGDIVGCAFSDFVL